MQNSNQGSGSNGGNRRQPQMQQQQQQFQQPDVNIQGISSLFSGMPELQNLVNLNQILSQVQGVQSQNNNQATAAQQAASQMMGAAQQYPAAPQYRQQQQARPPQQSNHAAPVQEVNLALNDHNAGLEVSERDAVQSLTINGHNNQVGIQETVTVPCVLANGHNNYVFTQAQSSAQASLNFETFGRIERLVVQGHNNRFENLIADEIQIFGHNNQFSQIGCQRMTDQGQNNKFRHLFKIESADYESARSTQQQARPPQSHERQARQQAQLGGQTAQQEPQYEFSTDEEAEFDDYDQEGLQVDVDEEVQDEEDEEDLDYGDSEGEDGSISQQQQEYAYHQQQQHPQVQTTLTLNINGQPVQINQNAAAGGARVHMQEQAAAALGAIPPLNNIQQLSNLLEQMPYLNQQSNGQQQQQQQVDPSQYMGGQQNFGGTFFTQDANNGGYYSSNGHTINIQGPQGGNIRVSVDQNGQAYYEMPGEDDLLDEFPVDPEEDIGDQDPYYDEENLDSEGEPLPSADDIKNIINSIPSFKFEEASNGYESSMSMSQASQKKRNPSDTFTERKKKEIKRQEKEVSCSICLEVLRTGIQVKSLECKHVFHTSCIHSWLKQKLQCPNCKKKVRLT